MTQWRPGAAVHRVSRGLGGRDQCAHRVHVSRRQAGNCDTRNCGIKLTVSEQLCILFSMSKRTVPPYPRYAHLARSLGARIRAARLRRRMSQVEMAERMGVDRNTLMSLERGELSVGLGVLVRALGVTGLDQDLARVAAEDEVGRRLVDSASSPTRRRRRAGGQ